jgi:hypothetical protein
LLDSSEVDISKAELKTMLLQYFKNNELLTAEVLDNNKTR